jgi:phosphoglycerol geranylgeranyltransferase
MEKKILEELQIRKQKGLKSLVLLIDPDKFTAENALFFSEKNFFEKVDFVFVGGSLIQGATLGETIELVRAYCSKPIVIFPGSNMHIDRNADGILLLSLISGRNPDFLIGQHIVAAPILRKSKLEILATGYMLVEGGKATTVSYMSNTTPIPHDKPEVATCIAMAGEMLGLKLIYLDTGSGAMQSVSNKMVHGISKTIQLPIIVGGGIKSASQAKGLWDAGADVLVVGNGVEERPELLEEIFLIKEIKSKEF